MFLANHAITCASASGSSFNSRGCFEPRLRAAVTIAVPVKAMDWAFDRRGRFGRWTEVTMVIAGHMGNPELQASPPSRAC
jgi:hypothetical protein